MRIRRSQILPFSLVLIGLTLAYFVGMGIAQPLDPASRLATLVLTIVGTIGVAWTHPRAAMILAVSIPLISEISSSSVVIYDGFLLLMVVIGRTWPSSSQRARRAGRVIAAFGAVTIYSGIFFSPIYSGIFFSNVQGQDRTPLALAVLYATGIGVAAAVSNMRPMLVFATISSLGAWASLSAVATPALRDDRTVVVLGENANGIGMFAALGFTAAVMASMYARGPQRWLYLIGVVICSWGVYVSGSRGAFVICVVGLTVLLVGRWLRGPSVRSFFVVLVAGGGLVFGASQFIGWFSDVTGRTAAGVDPTFAVRDDTLSYAIQQGLAHPVFGIGLGQLAAFSESDPNSRLGLRAHNLYAGIFAELGAPALILVSTLCILALYQARRHSTGALALVVGVVGAGGSLEWWGASRTGVLAMFILGWAAGVSLAHDEAGAVDQHKVYALKSSQEGQ
jgi:O-Antigen ligase